MLYVIAKRLLDIVSNHFENFGLKLSLERNIIPVDNTTLFVCSGMQNHKLRFLHPDNSKLATLQSCLRTNDLELVGDGSHLTYFEMLGNFSFGNNDYTEAVDLWHSLLVKLRIPVTHITVHPSQKQHKDLWEQRGYKVVFDESCTWSDGNIGGYCCEVYVGSLEVGNLVNTLGHSVDVGFGWERLTQVYEQVSSVHQTSLFRQDLSPIASDHLRALQILKENNVEPGAKGRNFVCRRLLQRIQQHSLPTGLLDFCGDWVEREHSLQSNRLNQAKKVRIRHRRKPFEWWKISFGLTPEDYQKLQD